MTYAHVVLYIEGHRSQEVLSSATCLADCECKRADTVYPSSAQLGCFVDSSGLPWLAWISIVASFWCCGGEPANEAFVAADVCHGDASVCCTHANSTWAIIVATAALATVLPSALGTAAATGSTIATLANDAIAIAPTPFFVTIVMDVPIPAARAFICFAALVTVAIVGIILNVAFLFVLQCTIIANVREIKQAFQTCFLMIDQLRRLRSSMSILTTHPRSWHRCKRR